MHHDINHETPPGTPEDPPKYCVALPSGTEGPYTRLELRQMLSIGRIKPDDRVIQDGFGTGVNTIIDLIPDARELAAQVEHVRRRSTSGEHRAQRVGSSSEVRRYRDSTANTAPISDSLPVFRPKPETTQVNRRIPTIVIIPAILITAISAWVIAETGIFDRLRAQSPISKWRVAKLGTLGGPWTFTLNGGNLTTESPNHEIFSCNADVQREDDYHTIITLSPAHPVLGDSITISSAAEIEIRSKNAKAIGQPVSEY